MIPCIKEKTPISAEEGAERVAKRHREEKLSSHFESEDAPTPRFCCENCGNDHFEVWSQHIETTVYTKRLACECEDSDEEDAVVITEECQVVVTSTGLLGDDHRVEWVESETGNETWETVDETITCQECAQNPETQEDYECDNVADSDTTRTHYEFGVYCPKCGHEVEFGWSHPDRGGRIWPCESSDFNPMKGWPEPRFREAWERRGWLGPAAN